MKRSPLLFLIFWLLVKGAILAFVAAYSSIELAPDEAQYWTWSQALDWGYYSKPPGIAWQIWATTSLFGNHVLGIRFGAILIGFALALALYALARAAGLTAKQSFWAGIAMAFCPLGVYLSFAATTDGGAILFLVLGIAVVAQGMREVQGPNYPLAGVAIFFGALFKWTAFILWPFVLFFWFFNPRMRKVGVIWGILISLCALLPSLYWNLTHEWATFRHVASTVGERGPEGNFFDFLGAQIGLLSPVFFVLLVLSYLFLVRRRMPSLYFCAAFPFSVLIFLVGAFFKKMQPNWAAFLYPPGMVLVAWVAYPRWRAWLHIGAWLSIVIVAFGLALPWIQRESLLPLPYKVNPFRQSMGWERLEEALVEAGYNPKQDFLFGDKYQIASLLSFYGPEKKRAYFFNVSETRKNQFSYWPQMEEREVGKTGYFVVLENTEEEALPWYEHHYLKRLSPYFKAVRFKGAYPLYEIRGKGVKYALIFECEDYLGIAPATTHAY